MHSFNTQDLHISDHRIWLYKEPNQLTELINDYIRLYLIRLQPAFITELILAVSV